MSSKSRSASLYSSIYNVDSIPQLEELSYSRIATEVEKDKLTSDPSNAIAVSLTNDESPLRRPTSSTSAYIQERKTGRQWTGHTCEAAV